MAVGVSLGFDLGGTQVRAALVQGGVILRRAAMPTDVAGGPLAVMAQFRALADQVVGSEAVQAVGLAAPGPLDTETGTVLRIPTLPGWDGFALRDEFGAIFGLPAVLENDGIAAAYGEWKHGAGQGLRHLVYVTVSTGIGGGVVVDGHLMHGRRGMAGHIGHMRVAEAGPVCSCGRVGCFEALAAGPALARRGQAAAGADPGGFVGRIAAAGARIEAKHVAEGARQGDAACLGLLRDEARWLGQGFASLAHLFSPERIIMGGGVAQTFDLMRDHLLATFQSEAMPAFRTVEIVPAALGDNAGLIGAASLALG